MLINKMLNTTFVFQLCIYRFISWICHSKAPRLGCKSYLCTNLNKQHLFSVFFHYWLLITHTNAWIFCMSKGIKVSLQQIESIVWMLINVVKICTWMFKLIFSRKFLAKLYEIWRLNQRKTLQHLSHVGLTYLSSWELWTQSKLLQLFSI